MLKTEILKKYTHLGLKLIKDQKNQQKLNLNKETVLSRLILVATHLVEKKGYENRHTNHSALIKLLHSYDILAGK